MPDLQPDGHLGRRRTTPTRRCTTRPTTAAPGSDSASASRSASASPGAGAGAAAGAANNNININNNNNYVNHYNRQNNVNRSGNSNWQHNAPAARRRPVQGQGHREKYGGGARGDSAQADRPRRARARLRPEPVRRRSEQRKLRPEPIRQRRRKQRRQPSVLVAELERPLEQRVRRLLQRKPGALVELARILEHERHVARRRRRAAAAGGGGRQGADMKSIRSLSLVRSPPRWRS